MVPKAERPRYLGGLPKRKTNEGTQDFLIPSDLSGRPPWLGVRTKVAVNFDSGDGRFFSAHPLGHLLGGCCPNLDLCERKLAWAEFYSLTMTPRRG